MTLLPTWEAVPWIMRVLAGTLSSSPWSSRRGGRSLFHDRAVALVGALPGLGVPGHELPDGERGPYHGPRVRELPDEAQGHGLRHGVAHGGRLLRAGHHLHAAGVGGQLVEERVA